MKSSEVERRIKSLERRLDKLTNNLLEFFNKVGSIKISSDKEVT